MAGELVIACGDAAPLLEAVEAAFDHVTQPVDAWIERAGAVPAAGAHGELVGSFGDGVSDPALAQVGADLAGGITLVGDQPIGTYPGPARAGPGDADGFDDLDQAGAVVDVAAGDDERQRQASSVTGEMDLGGQPAAGPPERLACLVRPGVVPFLRAPAACWWARTMVESMLTVQSSRPTASSWTCR